MSVSGPDYFSFWGRVGVRSPVHLQWAQVSDGFDAHGAHSVHCRYLDQIISVSGVASVFDCLLIYSERKFRTVLMLVVLMLITVGIWAANDDNKMTMVSLGAKEYNVGATYNPGTG